MIDKTPSDLCISVLRVIAANEPVTRAKLQEIMPGVSLSSTLDKLLAVHKAVYSSTDGRISLYSTTWKGMRWARSDDGSGVVAGPRAPIDSGTYTGQRPIYTRNDGHTHLPSRTGDTFTPYTRPLILASKVQSTRFP